MPDSRHNVSGSDSDAITAAARLLARGGIVVYPTETLYALGADACNATALQRLVELKVRQVGKPIAVLVSDMEMVRRVAQEISPQAAMLMRRFWPGPLTLVVRARSEMSPLLTGDGDGIGVRLSSHPVATALVRTLGRPVTAPSANPAGMPPPTLVQQAHAYFGAQVDHYLDGGKLRGEPASTVVDSRAELRVIREGAVAVGDILTALAEDQEETSARPEQPPSCGSSKDPSRMKSIAFL